MNMFCINWAAPTLLFLLLYIHLKCISCAHSNNFVEDIRDCPILEPRQTPPVSVDDLRPDDIKVVMALGDSVTAAFGAKLISFLDAKILQEYRGLSFSMGGDPNAPTISNFIKHYEPSLQGQSRGTHFIELCYGGDFCPPDELAYRPNLDVLNAALSGATSATLGLETRYLLRQLSKIRSVNMTSDWKMLTLFIGTNELCKSSCRQETYLEEEAIVNQFEHRLTQTLLIVKENIPRTLVNILLLPDMSQVERFANTHPRCIHARQLLHTICPCAASSESGRWAMQRMTAAYNDRIVEMTKRLNAQFAEEAKLQSTPLEFAITLSPILRDTDIRNDIPAHFAAKLDCFHPSATAHKGLALKIWKDLFVPFSKRGTHLFEQQEVYCPSDDDRFNIC